MHAHLKRMTRGALAALILLSGGCGGIGTLAQIVQPPRIEQAEGRPAELRMIVPSASTPAGGLGVTLWLAVTNPNPFTVTLSHLDATLLVDDSRAAAGSFPLGLPLAARQQSVVPLDLSVSFADVPGVAAAIRRSVDGAALPYALDGTIGIDAGAFGQPTFGPMRLMSGTLRVPALPLAP